MKLPSSEEEGRTSNSTSHWQKLSCHLLSVKLFKLFCSLLPWLILFPPLLNALDFPPSPSLYISFYSIFWHFCRFLEDQRCLFTVLSIYSVVQCKKVTCQKDGAVEKSTMDENSSPPPPKNSLSTIITSLSFLLFFNLIHKLDHLLLWRALHVQTRRYQVVLTCLTWDTNMEDSTHLPWKDAFIKNFLVVVFRGVKWVV